MAQAWMDIAWRQEGQKETPGAQANPEIIAYFREAGHAEVQTDEVAWCAAFICACLERAGIKSPRTLLARDFLNFGTSIDTARIGAIAIFSRPPDATHGHVGFVAGETATDIVLLGGNQADSVSLKHMPKARLLGLRWPGDPKTAKDLGVEGSRTIQATDGQLTAHITAAGATVTAISAGMADKSTSITTVATKAGEYKGALDTLLDVGHFLAHKWLWIGGAVALYFTGKAAWHTYQIRGYRTQDANTGAHLGVDNANTAQPLLQ